MYKTLNKYLDEINHYLWVEGCDPQEILKEIENHILEKTEEEFGKIDEAGLEVIIKRYGSPQNVARKYMEEQHIIEPTFKNYLFLYTGILFSIHIGLYLFALIFDTDIFVAPFIYIFKVNYYNILFSFMIAFVFDFGLVNLYLFLVTQKHLKSNLRWFRGFADRKKRRNISSLIITVILFLIGIYYLAKYNSIFIIISNNKRVNLISNSTISLKYSILILFAIGILIIYELLEFISNMKLLQIVLLFLEMIAFCFISKLPVDLFTPINLADNLRNNIVTGLKILFALLVIKVVFDLIKKLINLTVSKVTISGIKC